MPRTLVHSSRSQVFVCVLALCAFACGSDGSAPTASSAGNAGSTPTAGAGGSSTNGGGSGGSGASGGTMVSGGNGGGGAASGGSAGSSALCNIADPFGEPMPISELNTDVNDRGPRLTSDELTIVFSRDGVIYLAERAHRSAAFGPATPYVMLGSPQYDESAPFISDDGLVLFFEIGDLSQIERSRRANRTADFVGSSWVADGHDPYVVGGANGVLYVNRQNMGLWAAPLRNWQPGEFVLVSSVRSDRPVVTPDQLTMYALPGSLRVSQRAATSDLFETWNLVPGLEEVGADFWPSWISPDACRLYVDGPLTQMIDLALVERSPP